MVYKILYLPNAEYVPNWILKPTENKIFGLGTRAFQIKDGIFETRQSAQKTIDLIVIHYNRFYEQMHLLECQFEIAEVLDNEV